MARVSTRGTYEVSDASSHVVCIIKYRTVRYIDAAPLALASLYTRVVNRYARNPPPLGGGAILYARKVLII